MSVHARSCSIGGHGVLIDSGMSNREDSLGVCMLEFAAGWLAFWHAAGHGEQAGCHEPTLYRAMTG